MGESINCKSVEVREDLEILRGLTNFTCKANADIGKMVKTAVFLYRYPEKTTGARHPKM